MSSGNLRWDPGGYLSAPRRRNGSLRPATGRHDACRALGLEFREPRVIPNAVDPAIFHPPAAPRAPLDGRAARLITTSWSDNPNKGAATLARLEELLDPARFELTFVGRSQVSFRRIRVVPPVPSDFEVISRDRKPALSAWPPT